MSCLSPKVTRPRWATNPCAAQWSRENKILYRLTASVLQRMYSHTGGWTLPKPSTKFGSWRRAYVYVRPTLRGLLWLAGAASICPNTPGRPNDGNSGLREKRGSGLRGTFVAVCSAPPTIHSGSPRTHDIRGDLRRSAGSAVRLGSGSASDPSLLRIHFGHVAVSQPQHDEDVRSVARPGRGDG